ncbi:hypothetical protein D3C87_1739970 [compost metagenome]
MAGDCATPGGAGDNSKIQFAAFNLFFQYPPHVDTGLQHQFRVELTRAGDELRQPAERGEFAHAKAAHPFHERRIGHRFPDLVNGAQQLAGQRQERLTRGGQAGAMT